jgi:SAM-dependent methyltransferase
MTEFESRISSDTQTAAEFANSFRRSTDRLRTELDSMWAWATAGVEPGLADLVARSAGGDHDASTELGKLVHDQLPEAADRVVGAAEGTRLPIGPGTADFLNWATGHTGPAAQAGVWVNQAVNLFHHDGTVRVGEVNERIVEVPWVMGLATSLAPGSLVLDFGATESTVSLSLAALGLDVIAADLRPYPFTHPRIQSLVGPIEQWDGPDRPLDAVMCVSALEHVGLGAYGESETSGDLDRQIVERFARWLKPGGEIAFTAPYGRWQVDELQRVYDADHLDALFAGWEITARAICLQTGADRWERVEQEPEWSTGEHGVVLLRARRP